MSQMILSTLILGAITVIAAIVSYRQYRGHNHSGAIVFLIVTLVGFFLLLFTGGLREILLGIQWILSRVGFVR